MTIQYLKKGIDEQQRSEEYEKVNELNDDQMQDIEKELRKLGYIN